MEGIGITSANLGRKHRRDPLETRSVRELPAAQATFNVVSEELRTINRLRTDALREGQSITESGVTYRIARRGNTLAAIDGTSTVDSKEPAVRSIGDNRTATPETLLHVVEETPQETPAVQTTANSQATETVPAQPEPETQAIVSEPLPAEPGSLFDVTA